MEPANTSLDPSRAAALESGGKGRWAGTALLAIAGIHTLFGLLAGARIVRDPQLEKLVGDRTLLLELSPPLGANGELDLAQLSLFWFFAFGFALVPLGVLIRHLETTGQRVPRHLAVHLSLIALVGGAFIPASGFWTALVPAWNIWRKN